MATALQRQELNLGSDRESSQKDPEQGEEPRAALGREGRGAEKSSSVSVSSMVTSLEPHRHQKMVCKCGREGRKKGRRRMEDPGGFHQARRGGYINP